MRQKSLIAEHVKVRHFGFGPWVDEPDRIEFVSCDMPCLALRNMAIGHWCGYVAVSPGHAMYGRDADYWRKIHEPHGTDVPHCGISYCASSTSLDADQRRIYMRGQMRDLEVDEDKHAPEEFFVLRGDDLAATGKDWWLGFDFFHSGDYAPGVELWEKKRYGKYGLSAPNKNVYHGAASVISECRAFARDLSAMMP